MHKDDADRRANGGDPKSSSLSDRRTALLKLLAGSGAAYSVPLVASFSMGGLSLPAEAGQLPFIGNQCNAGNQPDDSKYYRIDFTALFTLDGVGPGRYVPVYFLVEIVSIDIADADGWSGKAYVWFGVGNEAPIFLSFLFDLIVSNSNATFTLVPPQVQDTGFGDPIRGGGPFMLCRSQINALTDSAPFPTQPIKNADLRFGATLDVITAGCGVLSLQRVRRKATLSTAGSPGAVPSGALPLATVPSGKL